MPFADLLTLDSKLRIDVAALKQTLAFAFATGVAPEAFDRTIGEMRLPKSKWDRRHFERDLFLRDFLDRCFPVTAGGRTFEPNVSYLLRAVSEPPSDANVVEMRRAVLRELSQKKALRADLETAYLRLRELRSQISTSRFVSPHLRRLEILRLIHGVFALFAQSFEGATSQLRTVRELGAAVVESEPYRRLDALLDHEAHVGAVDVRVRVGSDGEVRTFQIVSVRANRENPFYSTRIGRFFSRLRMFFQGYRMTGGEVRERLFEEVFSALEENVVCLFQLLGDMEFYLGALGFRDMALREGLSVCFPESSSEEGASSSHLEMNGLYNPLLLDAHTTPIPCGVSSLPGASVVMVTGPNSGGKTRLLQAIAIAQMVGEAGLYVPAQKASLPKVSSLFVSLVEEARSDQPEGQLGMELLRIRRMFEQLDVGSLVLIDELCSGTNPSEGEEIARLVISLLPELGAKVFVTTHLLSFAARLAEESQARALPLEFLQVELDANERPTYQFLPGVARTSLAQKTAARLGVTREELLEIVAKKRKRKP